MRMHLAATLAAVLIASYGVQTVNSQTAARIQTPELPAVANLERMTARFAPADIGADISALPSNERQALAKLVDAARLMDGLFLDQVWAGNTSLLAHLAADRTPLGRARLHYFLINKGPWSRLDHYEVFVPGAPPRPAHGASNA